MQKYLKWLSGKLLRWLLFFLIVEQLPYVVGVQADSVDWVWFLTAFKQSLELVRFKLEFG